MCLENKLQYSPGDSGNSKTHASRGMCPYHSMQVIKLTLDNLIIFHIELANMLIPFTIMNGWCLIMNLRKAFLHIPRWNKPGRLDGWLDGLKLQWNLVFLLLICLLAHMTVEKVLEHCPIGFMYDIYLPMNLPFETWLLIDKRTGQYIDIPSRHFIKATRIYDKLPLATIDAFLPCKKWNACVLPLVALGGRIHRIPIHSFHADFGDLAVTSYCEFIVHASQPRLEIPCDHFLILLLQRRHQSLPIRIQAVSILLSASAVRNSIRSKEEPMRLHQQSVILLGNGI